MRIPIHWGIEYCSVFRYYSQNSKYLITTYKNSVYRMIDNASTIRKIKFCQLVYNYTNSVLSYGIPYFYYSQNWTLYSYPHLKISCFTEWYRVLILFAKQHYLYSVDVHSQTTETQHEIDVWKRLDVIIMISSKVNFL